MFVDGAAGNKHKVLTSKDALVTFHLPLKINSRVNIGLAVCFFMCSCLQGVRPPRGHADGSLNSSGRASRLAPKALEKMTDRTPLICRPGLF